MENSKERRDLILTHHEHWNDYFENEKKENFVDLDSVPDFYCLSNDVTEPTIFFWGQIWGCFSRF